MNTVYIKTDFLSNKKTALWSSLVLSYEIRSFSSIPPQPSDLIDFPHPPT